MRQRQEENNAPSKPGIKHLTWVAAFCFIIEIFAAINATVETYEVTAADFLPCAATMTLATFVSLSFPFTVYNGQFGESSYVVFASVVLITIISLFHIITKTNVLLAVITTLI